MKRHPRYHFDVASPQQHSAVTSRRDDDETHFLNSAKKEHLSTSHFRNVVIVGGMSEPSEFPDDVAACRASIQTQAATIASQDKKIEELSLEMEKLRKLLSHFINGQRSEKRIITGPNQDWLPFETQEEFQAARARPRRKRSGHPDLHGQCEVENKKPRNESLPESPPSGRADHRRRRYAEDLLDARRANDHRLRHDRDAGP